MKLKVSRRIARTIPLALVVALLAMACTVWPAYARIDRYDGSGVPVSGYAAYTPAAVVNDTPHAPHVPSPPYAPYTPDERPYAPYEAGPVIHEGGIVSPYAPYEAGPVVH